MLLLLTNVVASFKLNAIMRELIRQEEEERTTDREKEKSEPLALRESVLPENYFPRNSWDVRE